MQTKENLLRMEVIHQRGETLAMASNLSLQQQQAVKVDRKCETLKSKNISHDGHAGSQVCCPCFMP